MEKRKREIEDSLLEINDWYNLIREAEIVRLHKTQNVNLKKKKEASFCFLKQNFSYDYKKQIINIEWRNYLDSIENEITVPVIFKFEDYEKKIKK